MTDQEIPPLYRVDASGDIHIVPTIRDQFAMFESERKQLKEDLHAVISDLEDAVSSL